LAAAQEDASASRVACLAICGYANDRVGRKLASLELKIIILLVVWTFDLLPIPESMASFAAKDMMTHTPQRCYVRLASAK